LLDQRKPTHPGKTEGCVFEGGRRVHLLKVAGRRRVHLLKVAGSLRGRYRVSELVPVLRTINEVQCRPPLTDLQKKIARDASKYPHPPPWLADPVAYCDDSRLSTVARLVLRLLADHACPDGRCFPGIRRLAQLANASNNTILKAINGLEAAERVRVTRSRLGNRYQLLPVGGA
jgi:Helix-turn-helix domain